MAISTLWVISDGKPGHLNQSLGLCDALQRNARQGDDAQSGNSARPLAADCQIITLPALEPMSAISSLVRRRWPLEVSQTPDLVIGAGHRTHLSVLAAARAFNAFSVLLMKPSLPLSWFDLCVVPQHDQPAPRNNVLVTRGVLNRMQPGDADAQRGMLLIGGPSKHHGWDNPAMVAQVLNICRQQPAVRWTLTTSRRTPQNFLPLLQEQKQANLDIIPVAETGPGWLAEQLPQAAQCWVSEDSVSMVYEALTAGCATGLLKVPQLGQSRVIAGVQALIDQQQVTHYSQWPAGTQLTSPAQPLREARRCAGELQRRLSAGRCS